MGRLSQIVEADGGTFAPVSALYKTLFADLLSKASRVDSYSSTDELLAEKGLTKADFSRLLQNSKATGRFERLKDLITEDLRDHGFTTIERARIIATCNKFMANRSRGEFAETQIGDAARKALSEDPAQIENAPSIFDAAETLRSTLEIELKFPTGLLLAGCLVSIAEGLDA